MGKTKASLACFSPAGACGSSIAMVVAEDPFHDLHLAAAAAIPDEEDHPSATATIDREIARPSLCASASLRSSSSSSNFRCLISFKAHGAGICALAISDPCSSSSADRILYSGSEDGLVCSYRLADLHELDRFGGYMASGSVKALLVRRGGGGVFSAHQDHKIRQWKRGSSIGSIQQQQHQHRLVATLPTIRDVVSSSILIPGRSKSFVRIRRHRRSPWNQHFDTISCMAVDDAAGILFSGSWDRTLKAWRLRDLRCLQSVDAHTDAINAVAVAAISSSPSSSSSRARPRCRSVESLLLSGSADSSVKVWRWRQSRNMSKTIARSIGSDDESAIASDGLRLLGDLRQPSPVISLAVCGNWIYAGCSDGRIAVWLLGIEQSESELEERSEAEEGGIACVRVFHEEFAPLCGHSMSVLSIAAAGEVVCSGSADRSVRVWRRDEDECGRHSCVCVLQEFHTRCPVKSVLVSDDGIADGCIVYSGGLDGFLKAWWVSLGGGSGSRKSSRITGESPCSVLDYG